MLILAFFVLLLTTFSTEAFNGKQKRLELDNGMLAIVSEIPSSPVVAVYAYVRTGSATEGKYLGTGISHYLEHMLFKGTKKRGVGTIAAEIQSLGGSINASTSKDYTIYTITLPHKYFDIGLDVLSDMLMNAVIDPEEAMSEKEVIIKEMRMINDKPDRYLSNLIFKSVYKTHPYRHPIIGYEDLFRNITHKELYDYYKLHYAPNNIIFSVAGNVKIDTILSKIKKTFKDFKRRNYVERNLPQESVQLSKRFVIEEYPTQITRVSIGYPSTGILDEDLYALDVLASMLGRGSLSRLYTELYQKQQLVYGVSAANYTPIDKGVFEINVLLDYENLNKTLLEVQKQIDWIKEKGIEEKELQRIKRREIVDYIFNSQKSTQIASQQMMDEGFTNDYRFSENYVKGIESVKVSDIQAVAKKYLLENRQTTVVLRPENMQVKEDKTDLDVVVGVRTKHVLDNGLRILLKEDTTFDIVSIHLAAEGGLRFEKEDNVGVSTFTMSLVQKGTQKYNFKQINEILQSRGIKLNGFSGRNSMGLKLRSLSEDVDVAMDLLEEFIKNPTFPKDQLEKMRKSHLKAIKNRKDSIYRYSAEILNESLFPSHPYRFRQGGYLHTVSNITQSDIDQYYKQQMVPENMVLSISGNINKESILKDLKERFVSLKKTNFKSLKLNAMPIEGAQTQEIRLPRQQAVVLYGYQGKSLYDKDYYKLEVLTSILGSSFNGRMFVNIRDKLGKAYTLGGYDVPGIELGGIYFYVMTTEENVEKVKELLDQEIDKLQKTIVSDKELSDIQEYLIGRFEESIETIEELNDVVILDELYGIGMNHYKKYKNEISVVTSKDVQDMAKEYLVTDKRIMVITLPEKK